MQWTQRDQAVWDQVQIWIDTLNEEKSNDFTNTYEKWMDHGFSMIPDHIKEPFLKNWIHGCFIFTLLFKVCNFKKMQEIEY